MVLTNNLKVGIVGCGLIGNKRAKYLPEGSLEWCIDIDRKRAEDMATKYNSIPQKKLTPFLLNLVDVVIVSTPNAYLAENATMALGMNKHVLIEKPAGISSVEILKMFICNHTSGVVVVGYNHRFHPAVIQAKRLIQGNLIGEITHINGYYGHGGAWLATANDWRLNKEIAGNGDLLEKCVHLVDLSKYLLEEELSVVYSEISTRFYNVPLEDNSFLILESEGKQRAYLQTSCTDWKNTFRLEIFGTVGKIKIEGLGGSYGVEKITLYKMLPDKQKPEIYSWEFLEDNSFEEEWKQFMLGISAKKTLQCASLADAWDTMCIIDEAYEVANDHS